MTMARCQYEYHSDFRPFEFKCEEQSRTNGKFCFFHDQDHYAEHKQEATRRFEDKVSESYSQKKPLECIGYYLPSIDFAKVSPEKSFTQPVYFNKAVFYEEANFSKAALSEFASFSEASFSRLAHFSGATFSEVADFSKAKFCKRTTFYEATFSGEANFSGAIFSGEATFFKVMFSAKAAFFDATFSEEANFFDATFSREAYFSKNVFYRQANFWKSTFSREADFYKASFSGQAQFLEASFSEEAKFSGATFSEVADFHNTTFSGKGDFYEASFSRLAHFSGATFTKEAFFYAAMFAGEADFSGTTFSGEASFNKNKFSGRANFSHAFFSKAKFTSATFSGKAEFIRTTFCGDVQFHKNDFMGFTSFIGTKFLDEAYFLDNQFTQLSAFKYAMFERPNKVTFDNTDLSSVGFADCDITRIRFGDRVSWGGEDRFTVLEDELLKNREAIDKKGGSGLISLELASSVYRNLRENYEFRLRYDDAGRFFIKEMELKRRYREASSISNLRLKLFALVKKLSRDKDPLPKAFYHLKENGWLRMHFSLTGLYYHLSRYGESISRPTLIGVLIVFLSTLFWITQSNPTSEPSLSNGAGFAQAGNMTHWLKSFERSLAGFLPLLSLGGDTKVGIIDYIIKIVGGALTFGLLIIAFRRKFERKYTR